MLDQSWSPTAPLVVSDELHKMADWKAWLKGVFDGRREGQALLVTGSARLDAFRQPEQRGRVAVERAADWLARLSA